MEIVEDKDEERMRIESSQHITITDKLICKMEGKEDESFSSDKMVFVCGLQPAKILLWTSTNWPSYQARVTSVNSVSALLFWPKLSSYMSAGNG